MRRCWALLFIALGLLGAELRGQEPPASSTTTADGRPQRTLKLPGPIDDIVVGGAGRFLIAHLKGVQKLAIIDVKDAKVVKYLPTAGEILFTAGAEKLYIVLPEQTIIQRWSLDSLEREVSAPLPSGVTPATLTMGHASLGPILIGAGTASHSGSLLLLNGKTMQPLPNKLSQSGRGFECQAGCVVRASANGQVFTSWRLGVSPAGFYTLLLGGRQPESYYEHESLGLLSPSADGTRIYAGGRVYTTKAKPVSAGDGQRRQGLLLPSVTGDYYLSLSEGASRPREDGKPSSVSIHLAGDTRPIVTLNDLVPTSPRRGNDQRFKLYQDKRVFYFPELSVLVLLSSADDGLDFITLDLDKELEKAGIDYLFASSRPPVSAEPGKTLNYQVEVKSKQGGVKISLASGPEGMKISLTGKLTWAVPSSERGDVDVILAISDKSGQEVFHTFRLAVGDSSAPATATKARPKSPAVTGRPANVLEAVGKALEPFVASPAASGPAPAASNTAASNTAANNTAATLPPLIPAKLPGDKLLLKLPAAAEKMEVGGGGRYLVLHLKSLRKLAIIDVCEAKIAGYIAADDENIAFAAGADKLVMILGGKNIITRWSLASRERELAVPLEGTYGSVAMGSASAGPLLLMPSAGHGQPSGFGGGGMRFYDLAKLRPIEGALPQNMHFGAQGNVPARVSADGRTFCLPGSFGVSALVFDGQKFQAYIGERHGSSSGVGIPSPDGQVIYCGAGRFSQQMRQLSPPDPNNPAFLVPAAHGRFYLAVQLVGGFPGGGLGGGQAKPKVGVHIEGDSRPLVQLEDFDLKGSDTDYYGHMSIPLDKRIVLVPDAKVIAAITPTFDAVELRRFDLDAALEAAGIDYLFVTSRPPSSVKPKEALKYQLEVKSKKGGVKYRLESGPDGMSLSPQGLLTWQAPEAAADAPHSIIIAVSDSAGQEVFHTFQVAIEGAGPKPAPQPRPQGAGGPPLVSGPGVPAPSFSGPRPPSPAPPALAAASGAGQPLPYAALIGKTRTWTDAASGRSLEATFVGVEGGKVKATREGGIEISIPLDRLSREDLLWLLGGLDK